MPFSSKRSVAMTSFSNCAYLVSVGVVARDMNQTGRQLPR